MGKLDGLTALVTGGSRGLGKEIARAFLAEGAHVTILAKNLQDVRDSADEFGVTWVCRDLSKRIECTYFVQQFDILVNNAAIHGPKGELDITNMKEWWNTFKVNLRAPALLMQEMIPYMRENKWGKIINISGGGATKPMYGMSAYAASKAALVRLTENAALELAGTGIDVNAVAPGALNTRLLDDVLQAGPEKIGAAAYRERVAQRESGGDSIERAAALCVWLASHESDGISGKLISAKWDEWDTPEFAESLKLHPDLFTLTRKVKAE